MEFISILTLVVAGIICLLFYFSKKNRFRRKFKRYPKFDLMNAKDQDIVALTGTVEKCRTTLEAPVSKRPCVYYEIIIEERASKTGANGMWRKVAQNGRGVNFFVSAQGGQILVNTRRVDYLMSHELTFYSKGKSITQKCSMLT